MAEGYARASGKPGVVLVTSGPGATNVVTPIQDAMSDGVPLVVFCGQVPTSAIGSDAFQEADILGITRGETNPFRILFLSHRFTHIVLSLCGHPAKLNVWYQKLISASKACTKWNTMVKDVAELPKRILEAFEIGQSLQRLCAEDYTHSSSYQWAPWACLDRFTVRACSSNC